MRMTTMSEAAPAYGTPTRRSRMRKTTADAAARAMELIELDGRDPKATLAMVGISRRSYDRYIASIEVAAPEVAGHPGGSQSTPAPLPLFQNDPELVRRVEALEQATIGLARIIDRHSKQISRAGCALSNTDI